MQDKIKQLQAPFLPSKVKTRKVAGKTIYYVSIDNVIARLNSVLGTEWSSNIVDSNLKEIEGAKKSFHAHCIVKLSILGSSREGIGAHTAPTADDALKGALAEATKKAAVYYGIGAELWSSARRIWCKRLFDYKSSTPQKVKQQLDFALEEWQNEETSLWSFDSKKDARVIFLQEAKLSEQEIQEFRNFLMQP